MKASKAWLCACTALAVVLPAAPALAQDASTDERAGRNDVYGGDIIVTALQFRDTRLCGARILTYLLEKIRVTK